MVVAWSEDYFREKHLLFGVFEDGINIVPIRKNEINCVGLQV